MANPIQSGQLDRRITIQSKSSSQNAIGESIESWSTFTTLWAKFTPTLGREYFSNDTETTAQATAKFMVRYRTNLTNQMRVVHDSITYEIVSIIEYGKRQGTEILVRGHNL
jgi:SPP1 family predicted phage head-tail adaptor